MWAAASFSDRGGDVSWLGPVARAVSVLVDACGPCGPTADDDDRVYAFCAF